MKKLSLSIIAKNEEQMIEEALKSCQGVDEIIILDTGSTDKTIEIGQKYGTVLTHYKWNDNFSESRNECKKHCTGDWLLIIDADEILNSPVSQLKNMINSAWTDKYDLLLFDVHTPIECNEQPRLIRNLPNIWYYGAAHNLPRYFPEGLEHPEKSQTIPHEKAFKTSYTVTARVSPQHAADPDRTLRILEKALRNDPMNTRNLYYYIREWLNRQDPYRALYYLDRYFRISGFTNECADAHFIAATCHLDLGDPMKAVNECMEAIKILPSFRAPYELMERLAHPEMRKYWQRFAGNVDNKAVLFIRDLKKIEQQNRIKRPQMKVIKK